MYTSQVDLTLGLNLSATVSRILESACCGDSKIAMPVAQRGLYADAEGLRVAADTELCQRSGLNSRATARF